MKVTADACEHASIIVASLKFESGEDARSWSRPQESLKMDPSGKFGQLI